MANELVTLPEVPEIVAIRKQYEERLPAIRGHFETKLVEGVKTHRNWLYGGAAAGGVLAFGSTAVAVLESALALATGGFIVAGMLVTGVVLYNVLPRLHQSLRHNEKIKLDAEMHDYILRLKRQRDRQIEEIQEEVRRNPIAFLQAEYERRRLLYEAQKTVVTRFAGRMAVHVQNFERRKRDNPSMNLSGEEQAVNRMVLFHKNRMDRLNNGFQLLTRFQGKIEEARVRWDLKRSAAETLDEERGLGLDAAFQEVLSDIAFDEVNSQFQTVFAQIEVDAQEMEAGRLEFAPNIAVDVTARIPAQR